MKKLRRKPTTMKKIIRLSSRDKGLALMITLKFLILFLLLISVLFTIHLKLSKIIVLEVKDQDASRSEIFWVMIIIQTINRSHAYCKRDLHFSLHQGGIVLTEHAVNGLHRIVIEVAIVIKIKMLKNRCRWKWKT